MVGSARVTRRAAGPVLMLGTVNHPHVEYFALAMHERGFDIVVGGNVEPTLPDSALPAAGIEIEPAPVVSRRTATGVVAHIRWVRRLLRRHRPVLVHAHWVPAFGFYAALAGAAPLIVTAWGSDVLLADRIERLANRIAMRRADLVTANAAHLLEHMVRLGARPARTMRLHWGVDLDVFAPAADRAQARAALGLDEAPTILSPRSLLPVYNIPTIVEAFARVRQTRPEARLLLNHMGPGELPDGLPERARLVGYVPHAEMAGYYRAADVCVSIPSSDGSPRSVWEAFASGSPVVVSDLPWVSEFITHEEHALVVPIDADAVAAAVLRLLTEPELAARLTRNAHELVAQHCNRAIELERLAGAYARLAAVR
jgi:glycosyltransferase involved in cell wall biosynthesis